MSPAFLRQNKACLLIAAIIGFILFSPAARAQTNTGPGTTVSATPATVTFTKAGLTGYFYSVSTTGQNTGAFAISTVTQAQSWISSHTPTGTFISTTTGLSSTNNETGGYGGSANMVDTNTIEQYLAGSTSGVGGDEASYSGPNDIIGTTILEIKGYIDVTGLKKNGSKANTLTIEQGSDDGSYLTVGGTPVITEINDNSSAQEETNDVTFSNGDGLYAIDLIYWNQEFTSGGVTNQGTNNYLNLNFTGGTVGFLYTVPEPAPLAAFAVGGLLMGILFFRKRLLMNLRPKK